MASRTAEAQHRVAAQRARIEQRVERLNERVHDDVKAARDTASSRKDDAIDRVPGRQVVQDFVQDRPLSALAAALGSGVALGIASESLPGLASMKGNEGDRSSSSQDSNRGGGDSSIQRLLGPALSGLLYPMQDEFRSWMRDMLSNRKPSASTNGRGEGRSESPSNDNDHAEDAGVPARAPDPVGAP